MKERSPIEARIISYAFSQKDMDLDRATLIILRDELQKSTVGLYDRLFGKEGGDGKGR